VAGSDSHTLAALGLTYTEVAGAGNVREFMHGLRQGYSRTHGTSGNYWTLTKAVWNIGANLLGDKPWTIALSPLFLAVPLVTLGNLFREYAFDRKWSRRIVNGASLPVAPACVTEIAS
jgi:hypothetical protein